jgi:Asp-tRNA(Asn)/Glu-tRNA(Gln) amidotransferase A subunit family amidase
MNSDPEQEILNDYIREVEILLNSKYSPEKSREFTKKYLQNLLDSAQLDESVDVSLPNNKPLEQLSAYEARDMILNKKLSLKELLDKYHQQKLLNKNENNSLTWSFYTEPSQSAIKLDKIDPIELKEKYPLAGYIFSVKECLAVKNSPATCGININLDRIHLQDPETIQLIKKKGGLITSKGNVPQFLLSIESNNSIYGITTHPMDSTRSAGGSSGGEAVNIVQGFANVSIGTDIAGSIRIPALFCGISGFKPTTRRVSNDCITYMFERRFGSENIPAKIKNPHELQVILPNMIGPLAKNAHDLEAVMKVLSEVQTFDYTIPPLPWRSNISFKKRIGVIRKMDFFLPSKVATRALNETEAKLERQGYEIIDMDVEDILQELTYWLYVLYNKNPYIWNVVTGKLNINEKLFPMYEFAKKMHTFPHWLIKIFRYFEPLESRKRFFLTTFLDSFKVNQSEIFAGFANCYKKFYQKMNDLDISAVLTIGLPLPAIKLMSSNFIMVMVCYLFIFNCMKMPAGVTSVTTVREDEQFYESQYNDVITEKSNETMQGSKGLSIGVQVAARCFDDEIVIEILKDIEK